MLVECRIETGILKYVKGTALAKEKGTAVMVLDTCLAEPVLESSLQVIELDGLLYRVVWRGYCCFELKGIHSKT